MKSYETIWLAVWYRHAWASDSQKAKLNKEFKNTATHQGNSLSAS